MSSRFENKYLITPPIASALVPVMASHMKPDPHGIKNSGIYDVHSIYYDSPDLKCYYEKVDGLLLRRKLRVRYYDEGRSPMVLEIKKRIGNQIVKERFTLTSAARANVERGRRIRDQEWHPAVETYNRVLLCENYAPKAVISYTRTAYVAPLQQNLRITIDSRLTAKRCHRVSDPGGFRVPLLPAFHSVLEIKWEGLMPAWIIEFVERFSLHTTAVSKYCFGIEKLMWQGQVAHASE
ncbi:MAG TPA: polyphosphate polymerase domain-containing protein [Planctomycetota bacterium]|jgi:SPX domain protein involved in polyphosphate accumulation